MPSTINTANIASWYTGGWRGWLHHIEDSQGNTIWRTKHWMLENFHFKNESNSPCGVLLTKASTDPAVISASNAPTVSLEYSYDLQTWSTWTTIGSFIDYLYIPANSELFLRGTNNTFATEVLDSQNRSYICYNKFSFTQDVSVSGDITQLLDPDGYLQDLSQRPYTFAYLFYNQIHLIDAQFLNGWPLQPWIGSYLGMFEGSMITIMPGIETDVMADRWEILGYKPTTIPMYCYRNMFAGTPITRDVNGSQDNSITLNSPNLGVACCESMFEGCQNITKVVLKSKTLDLSCYEKMFYGCSSLNHVVSYAETRPVGAYHALDNWLGGVASSGTLEVPLASQSLYDAGSASGIPTGWTFSTIS